MKQSYFGTDGIRQPVDHPFLQPDFLKQLGAATGIWLKKKYPKRKFLHVVIGRDTRASGQAIFFSLSQGLASQGIRIFNARVVPTPAIARAVIDLDLPLGIVITASHNPASDNGIKFFGPGGKKLSLEDEESLQSCIHETAPPDNELSPSVMIYDARRHYLESLSNVLKGKPLMGLRIVVDTANGATYRTSPDLLQKLGAQVISIANDPNGFNINDGVGSEHTEVVSSEVKRLSANLGIAHDGDGDRLILIDSSGEVVDGDAVLAILGTAWTRDNRLTGNTVVSTVMSNLGLDQALAAKGTNLHRSDVGDRNVFYDMLRFNSNLGGEASGHFIAMDYLPTGDGLLAALLVLEEMTKQQTSLAELVKIFQPFPQLKKNLRVEEKPPLESLSKLQSNLVKINTELGNKGRVLLRYSGTEPKIRLLVESADEDLASKTMTELESTVRDSLTVLS